MVERLTLGRKAGKSSEICLQIRLGREGSEVKRFNGNFRCVRSDQSHQTATPLWNDLQADVPVFPNKRKMLAMSALKSHSAALGALSGRCVSLGGARALRMGASGGGGSGGAGGGRGAGGGQRRMFLVGCSSAVAGEFVQNCEFCFCCAFCSTWITQRPPSLRAAVLIAYLRWQERWEWHWAARTESCRNGGWGWQSAWRSNASSCGDVSAPPTPSMLRRNVGAGDGTAARVTPLHHILSTRLSSDMRDGRRRFFRQRLRLGEDAWCRWRSDPTPLLPVMTQ
eukprot:1908341-Rhodomonas_salina.2